MCEEKETIKVGNLFKSSNNSNNSINTKENIKSQTNHEPKKIVFNKPKNWEKICLELDKEEKELEGVDEVFKSLYMQSDDDTKRAMMKSYYESRGTTLSMNWAQVGKKFVKPYQDENKSDNEN